MGDDSFRLQCQREWREAQGKRLWEEAREAYNRLEDIPDAFFEEELRAIFLYGCGADPVPLLEKICSGETLTRAGQLYLAQMLAGLLTKEVAGYELILTERPRRTGRPRKYKDSEVVIEIADQVREKQKTVPGNQRGLAIQEVAAERGVSGRTISKYLEHEDEMRKILKSVHLDND